MTSSTSTGAPVQQAEEAATSPGSASLRPSAPAIEWGVVRALWRRDVKRLLRERARWLGVVLQPLLFWGLLGSGMASVFQLGEGGPDSGYLGFLFPGILVMIVLFTTVFNTMAVIEDRQGGFLQQVLAGPASRAALVGGKTAGVTTVALAQIAIALLFAPLAGFGWTGIAWGAFVSGLVLGCVTLTGISYAMAWVLGSTQAYHALMTVLLLPLWMISGAMFPPHEGWLGVLMVVDPMTYMVDALRHALHGGRASVATTSPLVAQLVLLALATASFATAVTTTRRAGRWRP